MLRQWVALLDQVILHNVRLLPVLYTVTMLRWLLLVIKTLAHWVSGRSSLHRLCGERRMWLRRKGRLTRLIALHLRHSRVLHGEARLIFDSPANIDIDLDRLAKIVALRKGVPLESEEFGVLKAALLRIFLMERLVSGTIRRAKTPYRPETDKALLDQLWRSLHHAPTDAEHCVAIPVPDARWKELGFQGADPSTDFRGMGLLGLDQLVAFATHAPKSAHNILQQSQFGSAWYSFAPVGINITALIYGLLVSRAADEYFYEHGPELLVLNTVYQHVFEHFNEYWVLEEARDVMDFGRIFTKLRVDIETNLETHGVFFPRD